MQVVGFRNHDNLLSIVNNKRASRTMLTEFFSLNCQQGLHFLYAEFPKHFVWDYQNRIRMERHRGLCIGRLISASPPEGGRYYLRLLLLKVRGPTSFESSGSVDGTRCSSFRHAAEMHGLLEVDRSLKECMHEATSFQMPFALPRLFASLLVHCTISNPRKIWDTFYDNLSEDYRRNNDSQVKFLTKTLPSVSHFQSMGKKIIEFDLPTIDPIGLVSEKLQREISEEQMNPVPPEDLLAVIQLNIDQRHAYDTILHCVNSNKPTAFFIDGPGGTGKTFLYRALMAKIRSQGQIVLVVATSGIAASNLPGGRTAHSRFKIPLESEQPTTCNIGKQSAISFLIKEARLIIWDEASLARKQSVESFEGMLRDICSTDVSFGGKIVVFGGDFHQVLPVTPRVTRQEVVNNSLAVSYLWDRLHKIYLTQNMQTLYDPEFLDFLLRVDEGREKSFYDEEIELPNDMVLLHNA